MASLQPPYWSFYVGGTPLRLLKRIKGFCSHRSSDGLRERQYLDSLYKSNVVVTHLWFRSKWRTALLSGLGPGLPGCLAQKTAL